MEYRYIAIVLKKYDVGETDRLYVFMTREVGKVVAKGIGVRKPNAKLAGHLETGMLSSIVIMKRRGMGRITSAIAEKIYIPHDISFEVSHAIFQALLLFNKLVEEGDRDEKLFSLLNSFLSTTQILLQKKKEDRIESIRLGFTFQFLSHLGGAPEIQKCVVCNKRIVQEEIFISADQGGLLCESCQKNRSYAQRISPESIKILRLFHANSLESLVKLQLTKKQEKDVQRILEGFISRLTQ